MWDKMTSDTTSKNTPLEINGSNHKLTRFGKNKRELILNYYFKEWKNFTRYKSSTKPPSQKGETARTKLNDDSISPWNLIDLNKILLQHELDILKKYWFSWKRSVKNNRGFMKSKINGKVFHKNLVENQYSITEHETTTDGSLIYAHNDSAKIYLNSWKEVTRSHLARKSTTCSKTINILANPEKQRDNSETMCFLCSKSANNDNKGNGVSDKYLNAWRAEKNDSTMAKSQEDPNYKIEKFLNAVKAAKMKTEKRLKPNNSLIHLSRSKRGKSQKNELPKMNHQTREEDEWNQGPEETNTTHMAVTNKLSESWDSERTKAMAFIKEEVDASLAEAHTLLETTIAASYKGNCVRRKSFKHPKRNGSPIPAEMPVDNIVERMKTRELERAARWQQSRERREQLENERTMKAIEEEREKERQQDLSKKLKFLQLREKKIETLLREKHLEEVRERYHMLNMKALNHYNENLLHKGMQAFINELKISATLANQALSHFNKSLTSRNFCHWKNLAHLSMNMRISVAEGFHKKHMLRKYFENWSKLQREYILNMQAAIDFCDMLTQERAFVRWNQYTCDMMIEMNSKYEIADLFYNRCLLKKSIDCWKSLPAVMESERARERIKNSFRMKVLEIFPDFCPQSDNDA